MKDVGLIYIDDKDCGNEEAINNCLKFLDNVEGVEADTQEVIFGNFPVIVIGKSFSNKFQTYCDEALFFSINSKLKESENIAGQTLEDILDILGLKNIYLCGNIRLVQELADIIYNHNINPILIKSCIITENQEELKNIIKSANSYKCID